MSSDSAYAAFLDKANEPMANQTTASTQGFPSARTLDVARPQIPKPLLLDAVYSSETDEPWEPVVLTCDHFPGKDELARLVEADARSTVDELSTTDFDPANEQAAVVAAVQEAAGSKEVRVYRVCMGTRVEYFLLALKDGALVGLKARAVES